MTRQKILITGASSGLGAGMARQFAAKGRDLALCARRTDNLEELKAELTARHPGITVVARPGADGQRAKAMAAMEDMLQAHRDVNGVFGINDDSALGALSVIEAAGRTDVVVVGYDATAEAQAAIRRGSPLKADVIQYPKRIGKTAIEMIARHLAGEQVPASVPVEVGIVTADTLKR